MNPDHDPGEKNNQKYLESIPEECTMDELEIKANGSDRISIERSEYRFID